MTKKVTYIAGPMRGYKDYNFPAFDRAERILRNRGYHPVSPAAMDRLFEGWGAAPPEGIEFTPQDCKRFILRDLVALMDCDAICRLPGWQDSKGAKLEIALAEFLGLEIVRVNLANCATCRHSSQSDDVDSCYRCENFSLHTEGQENEQVYR